MDATAQTAGRRPGAARISPLVVIGAVILLVVVLLALLKPRPFDCQKNAGDKCGRGKYCGTDGQCWSACAWPYGDSPSLIEVRNYVHFILTEHTGHDVYNWDKWGLPVGTTPAAVCALAAGLSWPAAWPPIHEVGAWAARWLESGCAGELPGLACPLRALAVATNHSAEPPCGWEAGGGCPAGAECDPATCLCRSTGACSLVTAAPIVCTPSQATSGTGPAQRFERYSDAWPVGRHGTLGAADYVHGPSTTQTWALNPIATPAAADIDACEAACAAEPGATGYSYDTVLGRCALWPPPASRRVAATTPEGGSAAGAVYGLKVGSVGELPKACPIDDLFVETTGQPLWRERGRWRGLYRYEPQPEFTNLGRYPSGCWRAEAAPGYTIYSGMAANATSLGNVEYQGSLADCAAACTADANCGMWTMSAGRVVSGGTADGGWCAKYAAGSPVVADTIALDAYKDARGTEGSGNLPTFTGIRDAAQ